MSNIKLPPGYSIPLQAKPLNQFNQPGGYVGAVEWSILGDNPASLNISEDPAFPGDDTRRIVSCPSTADSGPQIDVQALVHTSGPDLVAIQRFEIGFPDAPADHVEISAGAIAPSA